MPSAPDQAEEGEKKSDAPAAARGAGNPGRAASSAAVETDLQIVAAAVVVLDAGDQEGSTRRQLMLSPSSISNTKVEGPKLTKLTVTSFCVKHRVKVPQMEGPYKPVGRPSRFYKNLTNIHRFHVEMFLCLIDRQYQELGDRFDEVNTELLHCMGSFSPSKSFAAYHMPNLVKLAKFYPMDFSEEELIQLPYQLTLFIADMRRDERFKNLENIVQLSIMLVETNKSMTYNLVYKLLKLVLTLPVATASVERVFSSMTFVKNKQRNKMGDQLLNDCLVTFIEREFFLQVKDDAVISRFQAMTDRMIRL